MMNRMYIKEKSYILYNVFNIKIILLIINNNKKEFN